MGFLVWRPFRGFVFRFYDWTVGAWVMKLKVISSLVLNLKLFSFFLPEEKWIFGSFEL